VVSKKNAEQNFWVSFVQKLQGKEIYSPEFSETTKLEGKICSKNIFHLFPFCISFKKGRLPCTIPLRFV
jgi:hypothetical protein